MNTSQSCMDSQGDDKADRQQSTAVMTSMPVEKSQES
ncbi:hypothetical protein SO3561_07198 [Streptomyces olivochromogenes]|uniref:Uncharacterized protein n=1 Tax=Streptomyces olivochromogenes TaxID=1963 RepID=A0A250VN55_STROL|nr:hypothetical protein SO3561_07198 [Streptomyces olivochromogenes]